MLKRWSVADRTGCQPGIAEQLRVHPLVAEILAGRGVCTREAARSFLTPSLSDMPDPYLLKGMQAAVSRLLAARRSGEAVCVYGDYDVDGVSGTALLVSFLRQTGFECRYFIPNRFDDGYGLNARAIDSLIARGTGLIVAVDCGISAVDEADQCRRQGVGLIIVDHHAPGSRLPDACAVLNPLQAGCDYPFKSLAGVGVAFNLLVALRAGLRDAAAFEGRVVPDLREWLDLVALGTIADIVPLVDQNRIYVHHGLKRLSSTEKPGILALKRVAGLAGSDVSCGQVGFRLAPRLNAAGRMESAVPGVELLLSDNLEESLRIADELDTANAERQDVERRIFEEAVDRIEGQGGVLERRSIVLASEGWHQGVVGIVASRLVERYHRPVILIALDGAGMGKGSGRSIPGFHLLDALVSCEGYLERFGGHRHAAGVSLRAQHVETFAQAFEATAAAMLSESDLIPRLTIDVEVRPEQVSRELALDLKRLEPFGIGNPEPVLMMRQMTVVESRVVGDAHLRLKLVTGGHRFAAIAFRMAGRVLPEKIDIAFYPEMNEWNGGSSLQLRIRDLRPAE